MALSSPGVEVKVIDESFYTPSAPGSVPMIFVATAANKTSASGSGVAEGTMQENIGRPYLLTGQRELGDLFGDPMFYSDSNNNMIHGSELNEYGLQAAYSALGISNQVYVTRADIDLNKLRPRSSEPNGEPADGAQWFDSSTTNFGVMVWNSDPITTPGGQSFQNADIIALDNDYDLVDATSPSGLMPLGSIGKVGDYAVVTYADSNQIWLKSNGRSNDTSAGEWVKVGSEKWTASNPTVRGSKAVMLASGGSINVNSTSITVAASDTASDIAGSINSSTLPASGVSAAAVRGILEIYSTGVDIVLTDDGSTLPMLGIDAGTYAAPRIHIGPHTDVPKFKSYDDTPAATGSIWIKTTPPNGGASFDILRYNSDSATWSEIAAPVYQTPQQALFEIDPIGGGSNLKEGDLYVKVNSGEFTSPMANYRFYERADSGETIAESVEIKSGTFVTGAVTFEITETTPGSAEFSLPTAVTFTAAGDETDAETVATAINAAGFENVRASVSPDNRIVIVHETGGDIRINDTTENFQNAFSGQDNVYLSPANASSAYMISLWTPMTYTPSNVAPASPTEDGELWYSSVIDEIDIMVHDGDKWVGYLNEYPDTRKEGPYIGASEPDFDPEDNDLWIDTSDLDNFPTIHRYVGDAGWVTLDTTDQTSDNGVLFSDARWSTTGEESQPGSIDDLLVSDYVDPDAPDPALYPRGMLLWNLRRSGFNVKRYVRNYIKLDEYNLRFDDEMMRDYHPHRWVTDSSNNADGSGSFGRRAQRKSVVQALQNMVNSNQEIRDDETRQFNIMACPAYPELIGEMISLNVDRGMKSFIVGDTPARLVPSGTTINEWAKNVNGASEDNDVGVVSYDEYMAMYFGWGYTSDNSGNNIVVPPSHMAIRTLLLNDQVAYPWFAPAGTRRGGVTNATTSGYLNNEGEFEPTALNTGLRDVLYTNAINPITFINGSGLLVYGQKTRARNASSLDRINVARLVVYLRGQLDQIARPYLFEPNDKITRDQVKGAMDSFFLELVGLRAVYDFVVVVDESNNTPERVDRNELWVDIAIAPVSSVEFIYIPLRLRGSGDI